MLLRKIVAGQAVQGGEEGPLFLLGRLGLISYCHFRKHRPGDGLTCYAFPNDIFFLLVEETPLLTPPIFMGRDN